VRVSNFDTMPMHPSGRCCKYMYHRTTSHLRVNAMWTPAITAFCRSVPLYLCVGICRYGSCTGSGSSHDFAVAFPPLRLDSTSAGCGELMPLYLCVRICRYGSCTESGNFHDFAVAFPPLRLDPTSAGCNDFFLEAPTFVCAWRPRSSVHVSEPTTPSTAR
jgi:hypothetical protein